MIVPSGIATDDTTKVFFANLVDNCSLVSLYDFENREKVFQGIDSRIKFCLLTLTGRERPSAEAEFAFFLYRTEQLQDAERRFTLDPEDFALFNPNTRTCPVFRTRKDAEIADKMYRRSGVFWKEAREGEPGHNPWGIKFSTMFHMANDSHLFQTREQLEASGWELKGNIFCKGNKEYLPLYEAKLFHQYDHRFATFDGVDKQGLQQGNAQNMTVQQRADPKTAIMPRYWICKRELDQRLYKTEADESAESQQPNRRPGDNSTHLAFRQIARATDERTGIYAIIPDWGLGHSAAIIRIGA